MVLTGTQDFMASVWLSLQENQSEQSRVVRMDCRKKPVLPKFGTTPICPKKVLTNPLSCGLILQ